MADEPAESLAAVNDASAQVAVVWASFLSVVAYLAVTVGSTTHLDLLIGRQITLPILGVDLDLVTFYWAAPLLLVLFHVYFLIQFYALSGKIHAFNRSIADLPASAAETFRSRLHIVMLTQALAGERAGITTTLVRQMTLWLTAVVLPVGLLLLFLVRFLPYHEEWMTWWHRLAILADLVFLFALWPIVFHPSGAMGPIWQDWRRRSHELFHRHADRTVSAHRRGVRQSIAAVGLILVLFVVVLPVLAVATIPDEWLERQVVAIAPSAMLVDLAGPDDEATPAAADGRQGRRMLELTAWLFEGKINEVTLAPESPFSRNLVIVQRDLVDDALFEKVPTSLNLRGRHLENAVFTGSDLHKADLSGANLDRASLRDANLQGASLACARDVVPLQCTTMRHADLLGVQLQGASLWRADLEGANLKGAQLQAADLGEARLDGADLQNAGLHGTMIGGAQLIGVKLSANGLAGASGDNMPTSARTPASLFLSCSNADRSTDILFLSQPFSMPSCGVFTFPKAEVDQVLRLYQSYDQAIRDESTRAQVRAQLIRTVASTAACDAAQAMEKKVALANAKSPVVGASWADERRTFFQQFDCLDLAPLKGPPPADAGILLDIRTAKP